MESVMAKHRLIKTWKQLQTLSLNLPYVMACERKQTFLLTLFRKQTSTESISCYVCAWVFSNWQTTILNV